MPQSPQQLAVVEFVKSGTGSAFVEAVAGAGKTTTLINALVHTKGQVAFAAYNKAIAEEINAKVAPLNLGSRVSVKTFHAFGYAAWRKAYPKSKLVDTKLKNREIFKRLEVKEELQAMVGKLLGHAKNRGIGLESSAEDRGLWFDIVEHHDLANDEDFRNVEAAVELAIKALALSIELAPEQIDFDDMLYMPLQKRLRFWQNDWLFVDEVQDTNPVRRLMARRMLKPNGRGLFVGDTRQAIYAFSGADADAVQKIISEFECTTLNLTVTFRCPKAVVELARNFVDHIEASADAPEGSVARVQDKDILSMNLTADDAILCRKTKPLVETAYRLIRYGVACHVEGREIGHGLLKLISRFATNKATTLRDGLAAYCEKECAKLIAKDQEDKADALRDRIDTIYTIMDAHPAATTVEQVRERILSMFTDSDNEPKKTLTLSTVHKAKGREWRRVFGLGMNQFMPSPYAKKDWQIEQEINLQYVMVTRAQDTFVVVDVPRPQPQQAAA